MLLNITTTHSNATDLGYLLGKHPDRWQTKELSFGLAHVFFPLAETQHCTASLLIDIDTTQEMRQARYDYNGRNANVKAGFDQYVSDRAYVASSLLASAIAKVYGSALNGKCNTKPALPAQLLPLTLEITAVRLQGPAKLLYRLFEPLGYQVTYTQVPLDEAYPGWGKSPYYHLKLQGQHSLQSSLQHLYILLPILDNQKHYYFKEEELEKLLEKAKDWLVDHPEKLLIINRYLSYKTSFQQSVLNALQVEKETLSATEEESVVQEELLLEKPLSLHQQRHEAVISTLMDHSVKSVLDLGCSNGKLLQRLLQEPVFTKIAGVDVDAQALQQAGRRTGLIRRNEVIPHTRLELIQAALTYRDQRFNGYDAAVLIEVIEHLEPERLPALEKVVFKYAQPRLVIVTTPNAEYNVLFENLTAGVFRHPDHRFEWDRATFENWAERVAEEHAYTYYTKALGEEHPVYGGPSQMAVFLKTELGEG
jgi:3' terminal RNA ribose 2'-O-methyltransferase Hen1